MPLDFHRRVSPVDALSRYTDWLATTRHYTERSKREYTDDVADLVQWLTTRCHIRAVTAVQRTHLTAFLAHCVTRGHASSTRRRSVAAIRSFFAFLVQERILSSSPAADLLPPERETRPPRVLTEAEYTRLRAAAADSARDSAIIELVLQTGLRLSEIARLTLSDVIMPILHTSSPLPIGHIRIAGRGHRSRTITLNIRACEALMAYLPERDAADSPALFLTKFGKGIGPRGIENVVAKHCKEVGITGASVHSLRHTMAVQMIKRGATPAVVGKALGHASSETTSIYVELARALMDEELQRAAL